MVAEGELEITIDGRSFATANRSSSLGGKCNHALLFCGCRRFVFRRSARPSRCRIPAISNVFPDTPSKDRFLPIHGSSFRASARRKSPRPWNFTARQRNQGIAHALFRGRALNLVRVVPIVDLTDCAAVHSGQLDLWREEESRSLPRRSRRIVATPDGKEELPEGSSLRRAQNAKMRTRTLRGAGTIICSPVSGNRLCLSSA